MKHGSTTTKVIASVFWDAHGILFINYLEEGKTINSDSHMSLLDGLSTEVKKKRPHMQKKCCEEVIAETEAYFECKDELFYKTAIEKLEKRWNECIALEGNYHMLMNKVEFFEKTVFFLVRPETY